MPEGSMRYSQRRAWTGSCEAAGRLVEPGARSRMAARVRMRRAVIFDSSEFTSKTYHGERAVGTSGGDGVGAHCSDCSL